MALYHVARQASDDLDAIWLYIAEDSPVNADRFIGRLYDAFLALAYAPHIGASRFNLAPNLRMFPVREYLIFYHPIEDGVEIVRVLHGRQRITSDFF